MCFFQLNWSDVALGVIKHDLIVNTDQKHI